MILPDDMLDFVVEYKGDGDCCRSCWYQDSKSICNAEQRCKYEESCEDRASISLRLVLSMSSRRAPIAKPLS